jgi:hypothetical protein
MIPSDDWRVRARLHGHGLARAITERLDAADLEHNLEEAFEDKVIVSVDGAELFAYTGSREQADAVVKLISEVAADHEPDLTLERWHPTAQSWEDADEPLPSNDEEQRAERAERLQRERAEAAAQGYPDYEVRVACASRQEAEELADRLSDAGLRSVRRDRYLLLGAADEDAAAALAEQVRGIAGSAAVSVEASGRAIEDGLPPNPFAILGGLGG